MTFATGPRMSCVFSSLSIQINPNVKVRFATLGAIGGCDRQSDAYGFRLLKLRVIVGAFLIQGLGLMDENEDNVATSEGDISGRHFKPLP